MSDYLKFLFEVWTRPVAAMGAILDRGSLLAASLGVLAVSLLLETPYIHLSFYLPLLMLALFYVPGVLLLSKLLARVGGGWGSVFERDYSPLLTCTAMAWTAAILPLVAAERVLPPEWFLGMAGAAALYFAILMFFAVRTVFGTGNGAAVAIVCLSWIPLVAAAFLWSWLAFLLGWLSSPFFLLFAYFMLRGEISGMGEGLRRRQSFHRMLDAAALNPHDSDAQYQLGLIYQQRHQFDEAIRRFERAVAIDPGETGAQFQLGRIARQQGRLRDALARFQTVVDQDEKFSQNEVLRELGAVYVEARQYQDARRELEQYAERRPYDPEGLYYYGRALEGLGKPEEARGIYQRTVEAARTAPRYLRRFTAQWSRLAQKQLRKLPAAG